MVLETFDQEKYEKAMHQEGYEDGYSNGKKDGRTDLLREQIQKKLSKGKSIESIAEELETDPDTVRSLASTP